MDSLQILVVEDESIIAKDIQSSLLNLGYSVTGLVSSGEEAIKMAGEKRPDLVLMDIMLRGETDGIDTANEIRKRFGIPIIFCTAYADDKMIERAKVTEPFGYMIKPFEDRELNITIKMATYKHKMEIKLKENQEWFSTILKSINDALIATDVNGCITLVNRVAESLVGFKQEELMGKELRHVLNIIDCQTGIQIECPVITTLRKHTSTNLENSVLVVNNDHIQIEHTSIAIKNENGNIIGAVMVFRDITMRIKTENSREKLILKLQKALTKINTLSGLLPICASCKKIRDDKGYWNQIELYIQKHSGVEFTHSICPDCSKLLYPEIWK